jgi:hypothetical protein
MPVKAEISDAFDVADRFDPFDTARHSELMR